MGSSKSGYGTNRGLLWCVAYGLMSCSLSLLNKQLFSGYGFSAFTALSLSQLVCAVVLCQLGAVLMPGVVQMGPFRLATLRKVAPLALLNSLNVLLGFFGLQLVNVPMFLVLRRVTTPLVLLAEFVLLGKVASREVMGCVALSLLGTLVAGSSDLSFDLAGYVYTMLNNLATAAYLVTINKLGTKKELKTFEVLFYNSLLSIGVMLPLSLATGDLASMFTTQHSSGALLLFLLSSIMGFFFNVVVFLCTQVNSALATSITGNIKDCATTLLGFVLFEVQLATNNVVGVHISLVGGVLYSFVKLKESEALKSSAAAHKPLGGRA